MMARYSDLQTYRQCPRKYGLNLLGYRPVIMPEPMEAGSFTHKGIEAYLRGLDYAYVIEAVASEHYKLLATIEDVEVRRRALDSTQRAADKAIGLVARYATIIDYQPLLIEFELAHDGVVTHPDLLATSQGKLLMVDYKTGKSPDVGWLDISGQLDLAAYMHRLINMQEVDLVSYDIIADEYMDCHQRPPRYHIGKRLYDAIRMLSYQAGSKSSLLEDPHADWTCPHRCSFYVPCHLMDVSGFEAALDYLESSGYYYKEVV